MVQEFAGIPLEKKIIMGVVNLSPETFYEGSLVEDREEILSRVGEMIEGGAQIIDLGAMSTGPEVEPISEEKEKEKLLPAVEIVGNNFDIPISVDTQRAEVARESLETGANIINDVSGFKADSEMPKVASNYDCYAILMASGISGRIRAAEKKAKDIESIEETKKALKESLQICEDYGVSLNKVAVDPSIGFGRERDQDLEVIAELEEFSEFDQPICIGVSRKSSLGKSLNIESPSDRLPASLGATAVAVMKGADIVRTHDPRETVQAVRMVEAIERSGMS